MKLHPTIYVNGYGATHDANDGNYGRYIGELMRLLRLNDFGKGMTVYLCGGHANRTDLTEARCMLNVIQHSGLPVAADFVLVEESTTSRDNLLNVCQRAGRVPLTVFCEYTRAPAISVIAKQYFPEVQMAPVAFDHRSLAIGQQLRQRYLNNVLDVAALYSPTLDALRTILRERHVAKCHAQER